MITSYSIVSFVVYKYRILFGTTQLFVFIHPEQEKKAPGTYSEVTFELAQEEIASKAGYTLDNEDQTMEVAILNKDLMEVLPAIDEANAIADELERNTRFEVMLVAPQILGKSADSRTEVRKKRTTRIWFSLLIFTHNEHIAFFSFLMNFRPFGQSLF